MNPSAKNLVKLATRTESFLNGIGSSRNLHTELSYYDQATLRLQFPSLEHLAVRLFDSWWNTYRKQLLLKGRFPKLEQAVHRQGFQSIASMSMPGFNAWLISAFGLSPNELDKKLTWKQFIDQGGAWACLQFIAQFTGPKQFYEWIDGRIGAGSWKAAKRDWQKHVEVCWKIALDIQKSIPGMGTVLVCDFFKETGVECYGKPDGQVKKVFDSLGLLGKGDHDWQTFKLLWRIAALIGCSPAIVDKIFWMASSGRWDKTLDSKRWRGASSHSPTVASIQQRKKQFQNLLDSLQGKGR